MAPREMLDNGDDRPAPRRQRLRAVREDYHPAALAREIEVADAAIDGIGWRYAAGHMLRALISYIPVRQRERHDFLKSGAYLTFAVGDQSNISDMRTAVASMLINLLDIGTEVEGTMLDEFEGPTSIERTYALLLITALVREHPDLVHHFGSELVRHGVIVADSR